LTHFDQSAVGFAGLHPISDFSHIVPRMNPLTPYPELDAVFKEHAERIQKTLGDSFVGCYLQGSLAIGDFDLSSDIDFIVVTGRELAASEVEKVQAAHLVTYDQDNRWVKRLEYSFSPKINFEHGLRHTPKTTQTVLRTGSYGTSITAAGQSKNPITAIPS
jgi:hypothetical protein